MIEGKLRDFLSCLLSFKKKKRRKSYFRKICKWVKNKQKKDQVERHLFQTSQIINNRAACKNSSTIQIQNHKNNSTFQRSLQLQSFLFPFTFTFGSLLHSIKELGSKLTNASVQGYSRCAHLSCFIVSD